MSTLRQDPTTKDRVIIATAGFEFGCNVDQHGLPEETAQMMREVMSCLPEVIVGRHCLAASQATLTITGCCPATSWAASFNRCWGQYLRD